MSITRGTFGWIQLVLDSFCGSLVLLPVLPGKKMPVGCRLALISTRCALWWMDGRRCEPSPGLSRSMMDTALAERREGDVDRRRGSLWLFGYSPGPPRTLLFDRRQPSFRTRRSFLQSLTGSKNAVERNILNQIIRLRLSLFFFLSFALHATFQAMWWVPLAKDLDSCADINVSLFFYGSCGHLSLHMINVSGQWVCFGCATEQKKGDPWDNAPPNKTCM